MSGSGGDHRGPVVLSEVLVSGIDVWFVSVGVGNARLEVVWHQDLGDAPEELERMDMGCDPGG